AEPAKVLPQKQLIVGGEGISESLLNTLHQYSPSLGVLNHYGPTESTVGVFTHPLINQAGMHAIQLGLPLANTQAYVLGADLQPVPKGVVGELYLGGEGLAQGYL
ncbi:AMP-binding protein, partial [Alteromonas sp. 5E99-2]|uniref:AMP-binding protein n=1 Tax=Alteromonas sp. 5E99-2 TaxID=2817683 RepID=UPI001A9934A8